MSAAPIERQVIKVSVLLPTHKMVKTLAKEHGCTQQELFGRLLDWFAKQPKAARVLILSGLSEQEIASVTRRAVKKKRRPRRGDGK